MSNLRELNPYRSFTWLIFVLLLALMPSFYLHHRINGFIAMLIIIIGVVQFVMRPITPTKMGFIMLMPALFITLLMGQFYTTDLKTGWTLVERSLSILLIPFAMYGTRLFSTKQQHWLILSFIISALIASIYCLLIQTQLALNLGTIYTSEKSTHFLYNIFMHHKLSSPLGLHAVYFSSFIAFINIYLYNTLFVKELKLFQKTLSVLLMLFFTVMIFLLKSAIISFGFSLVIILITFVHLKKVKNILPKIGLVSVVLITMIYAFFAVQSKMEFIDFDYEMSDQHMGMLAIRLSIWENALTVIKSNLIFGVGTGDADLALLNQFKAAGFTIGVENDYNCHNMYLQYYLGNGLVGVTLFLAYLALLFKKALRHKNMVFIGFLIVFVLFSFTESTLRVQKGMVFFMVLSSLFYWSPNIWKNK